MYLNKIDSLLKQILAFHKSTRDITPCRILDHLLELTYRTSILTLKKKVAVPRPNLSYISAVWKPIPP